MNIAVRYQSRGGNTKVIAEAIAKAAGVIPESIDVSITEPIDLLIVGGGVYAWKLDKSLIDFLENLDSTMVKKIAAFTTAGGMNKTKDILKIAGERGIAVCEETLAVKFLVKYHAFFGGAGKARLNGGQEAAVQAFVEKVSK